MKLKRINMRVPKPLQYALFCTLGTSWVTGLTYFILRDFFQIEGAFGPEKHPFQMPALTIHGAAAFLMMMWFGAFLAAHLPYTWKSKRSRYFGIGLISLIGTLVISGYLLYYIPGEDARVIVGYTHLVVGACLPIILATHIITGIKGRP